MDLITIEKQTGAKRLHREYLIVNGENFIFSQPHEVGEGGFIQFKSDLENDFKLEVDAFRSEQKIALSKEARKENITETTESANMQGSDEWLNDRIGIISASNTPFNVNGKPIPSFDLYVAEKVSDAFIHRNEGDKPEKYVSEAMIAGIQLEVYGRERYEEVTGRIVQAHNLITSKLLPVGASPDGITIDEDGNRINIEIKSVMLKSYIAELQSNYVSNQYKAQVMTQMYLEDIDCTDFIVQTQTRSGQPLDIIIRRINRDEEYISSMIDTIKLFEERFAESYKLLENKIRTK